MVAGAAPPASMIEGMEQMGFDLTHVYGLTEVYGPATVCAKHESWDRWTSANAPGSTPARACVTTWSATCACSTRDDAAGAAGRRDHGRDHVQGQHRHEGLPEEPQGDAEAFAGGWFHSGDLAVQYPDGYFKIKDRSKDIIISGGENISSIEVEDVLYRHPDVLAAAVVARPDPKWGETPCAFVELKVGAQATPEDIVAHCKPAPGRFQGAQGGGVR
jgi:fatty-acyl-CoA synthase